MNDIGYENVKKEINDWICYNIFVFLFFLGGKYTFKHLSQNESEKKGWAMKRQNLIPFLPINIPPKHIYLMILNIL